MATINRIPRADRVKDVILSLIAAAPGGQFFGVVRLNKAFYLAHLQYWQTADGVLTRHPIVRLPNGPVIDGYRRILREMEAEGLVAVTREPNGPFMEDVITLLVDLEESEDTHRTDAIEWAAEYVHQKSGRQLIDEIHERSRSWQESEQGAELDIYRDTLSDLEIEGIRADLDEVRAG